MTPVALRRRFTSGRQLGTVPDTDPDENVEPGEAMRDGAKTLDARD